MLNVFKGLSLREWALIFLLLAIASSLRFLTVPNGLSAALSSVHLIEFFFFERLWRAGKFPTFWVVFSFNPVSLYLLNLPGVSFWIFEGAVLAALLYFAQFRKLAFLTAFFTLALVFL